MSAGQWLPLVGLTLSAFIFNTSEFMPIGLLTDIAVDLHVTEARAGMLISVYAWVVALLSLPLMLLVARMEYNRENEMYNLTKRNVQLGAFSA